MVPQMRKVLTVCEIEFYKSQRAVESTNCQFFTSFEIIRKPEQYEVSLNDIKDSTDGVNPIISARVEYLDGERNGLF